MNVEVIELWAAVLVMLAGLVLVALDVCALNRHVRWHDREMTQVWTSHAQMAERLAELERDAARGARGVPDITPQQERTEP